MRPWHRKQSTISSVRFTETELDQAWNALTLILDWIKHAEAKAGAVLAAVGFVSVALYYIIGSDTGHNSHAFIVAAVLCGTSVFVAGICASLAILPRLRVSDDPPDALYFRRVARDFPGSSGRKAYIEALSTLVVDGEALVTAIAAQIWANSQVANSKYRWITASVVATILGLVLLATSAALKIVS